MRFNKGKCIVLHPWKNNHVPEEVWRRLGGKGLCREGSECPDGQHADHEPAVCPCGLEGPWHSGAD